MKKILLQGAEIRKLLDAPATKFPTYVAPLLNLANRFAGGTRPRIVGQMSDLFGEFKGKNLQEWIEWYQQKYPDSINKAAELIRQKVDEFRCILGELDDNTIERWVEDLVLVKTYIGLRFQEAILKKLAEETGQEYMFASPEQEARGIDGVIGSCEVSIKPISWREQQVHRENLEGVIVYYRKTPNGIEIEYDPRAFGSG